VPLTINDYNQSMNRRKFISQSSLTLLLLGIANNTQAISSYKTSSYKKYARGKCGANMMDKTTLLNRTKVQVLKQMREDDKRRQSIMQAKSITEVLNAV